MIARSALDEGKIQRSRDYKIIDGIYYISRMKLSICWMFLNFVLDNV